MKKINYLSQNNIQQPLNELFALPVGMKHVITLDNQKLYSSDKLKQKFVDTLFKTGRGKPIATIVDNMIRKKEFIPAFVSKSLFKLIKNKVFPGNIKQSFGFYAPKRKLIVICMDQNISWGFANDDWLAKLTIHEGMHKCAVERSSLFFSTFRSELERYYSAVFQKIFSLEEEPKEISKIVKFLFYKCEKTNPYSNTTIMSLHKILQTDLKKYTTLKPEEFENLLRDYIVAWKIYSRNPQILSQNIKRFVHVIRPLIYAYKDIFGGLVTENFYIQEIMIPSEVIAIRSEIKPDAKIYKAFSALK